ncbi:unnamed protein product [Cuscuta campestris]|uniref:1,3-beta-glucan synthase component FKS1-like domain-containing protein n=1 Tax=Cuscuta campestris TaxID=132261 RepID=A0A484LUQ5_9ASTE|nr:unnamed protein product [Cuscuta campestris]
MENIFTLLSEADTKIKDECCYMCCGYDLWSCVYRVPNGGTYSILRVPEVDPQSRRGIVLRVERVYDEIQRSIANRSILVDIELNKLPLRIQKVTALLGILEARHNDNGRAPHSAWRNYDDFNEYFWSLNCFELSWPWRITSPFFLKPTPRSKMNVVTCVVATTYGHVYIECPVGEPIPF